MMPAPLSLTHSFHTLSALICLCLILGGCGYSDEMHQRQTLRKLLWNGKYIELDKAIDQAYVERQKGKLSSNRLRGRFWQLQQTDSNFAARFDAWVANRESAHAYLARGWYRLEQASKIRGDGPFRSIPVQRVTAMRDLAMLGTEDMAQALRKDPLCAMCVSGQIYANLLLGQADPTLLDTAISLDPKLWQPFALHLMSLSPQWGGSDGAMTDFIDKMERRGIDRSILDQLQARRLFQLGLILQYSTRDFAGAQEKYEQAIAYFADSDALKNLAELHAARGNHAKAASLLEKDLSENDEWDLYSIEALAQAYFADGRESEGNRMLRRRAELYSRYRNGE